MFNFRRVRRDFCQGGGGEDNRGQKTQLRRHDDHHQGEDGECQLLLSSDHFYSLQVSCAKSSGLTLATMGGVVGGVIFGLVLRFVLFSISISNVGHSPGV